MNLTQLRQRPQWLILGTVILAAAIGGALRVFSTQAPPATSRNPEQQEQPAESTALFQSPMVSLSDQFQGVASPAELLISTSSEERLSAVSAGRLDPFAPVTQAVARPQTAQSTPATASASVTPVPEAVATSQPLPTAPVTSTTALPPVPNFNGAPAPAPLPAIPIAANPIPIPSLPNYAVPLDPVQAIELSGVVQIGDRVGVIVREANGQTSRHIFAGDYLAGGQVLVKSIDLSAQEPLVILEYQGQEYPRMVGSGGQTGIS
ncbi:MAG: hypothetical protein F6J95_033090 [Leptolyngbya sp. SIO1E4]|nr:hypothetical protein [Leptolyngbya sp. SIO1E4]